MILYNVTVKIDNAIKEDWLEWMRKTHIPDVMKTGFFTEHKFCKLIFPTEEDGTTTYAIQYFCSSMNELETYQKTVGRKLQAEHSERYKERFIAIRSLMEVM